MKILVHLHLYYTDMLPEMLNYLRSLDGKDYDLYVTMVQEDGLLTEQIFAFKKDARILIVENRGYDIAPFLKVLKTVDLNKYSYVVKLHTKRDLPKTSHMPLCDFRGAEWRNCLTGFIKDKDIFSKTIAMFEQNPDIGMISHYQLVIKAAKEDRTANQRASDIMKKLGVQRKAQKFVAGTMFICRATLMSPLQKLPYEIKDFDQPAANHAGGTLAHALERVFGWLVYAQGCKIASYAPLDISGCLKILACKSSRFLYRKHTNAQGVTRIKVCKIPVYKQRAK